MFVLLKESMLLLERMNCATEQLKSFVLKHVGIAIRKSLTFLAVISVWLQRQIIFPLEQYFRKLVVRLAFLLYQMLRLSRVYLPSAALVAVWCFYRSPYLSWLAFAWFIGIAIGTSVLAWRDGVDVPDDSLPTEETFIVMEHSFPTLVALSLLRGIPGCIALAIGWHFDSILLVSLGTIWTIVVLFVLTVQSAGPAPRTAEDFVRRGKQRLRSKALDSALLDCTVAIKLGPSSSAAYELRGKTWEELGNLAKAISDYDTAIELDPVNKLLYVRRSEAKKQIGAPEDIKIDLTTLANPRSGISWGYLVRGKRGKRKLHRVDF